MYPRSRNDTMRRAAAEAVLALPARSMHGGKWRTMFARMENLPTLADGLAAADPLGIAIPSPSDLVSMLARPQQLQSSEL